MELEFWGVRGTVPSPGADKTRYGGHTHCVSLRTPGDETIVIDSGTGIKDLGARIMAENPDGRKGPIKIALLLTHFHIDHILGFPFFAPLFSPRALITVYGPAGAEEIHQYLGDLMSAPYFPIGLEATPSAKRFCQIKPGLAIDGVQISTCPLIHPQGSIAYALEQGGTRIVSATDTEHPAAGIDERLAAFEHGAAYLIYDAMYTPAEYAAGKKGWGHSTWLAGTELAAAAGVETLVLSHYNPDHNDNHVDDLLAAARERFPRVLAARQGMKLTRG